MYSRYHAKNELAQKRTFVRPRLQAPPPKKRKRRRRIAHFSVNLLGLTVIIGMLAAVSLYILSSQQAHPTLASPQVFATSISDTPTALDIPSGSLPTNLYTNAEHKLQQEEQGIAQLKAAGKESAPFQQRLEEQRSKLATLTSHAEYVDFLIQVGLDLTKLQQALGRPEQMLENFRQDAQQWGDSHKYENPYDHKQYYLNSSYLSVDGGNGQRYGETAYLQQQLKARSTTVAQDIVDDYFLHAMLEANYEEDTPYNRAHRVDAPLLSHFGWQNAQVLLVSLTEQSMRIYEHGKLVKAYLITTGREHRPTPAGHFRMTRHQYNLRLSSFDSPSSLDYYKPVVVSNAIQFWENGYLLHSSQWRKSYGPFTQFPHKDAGGELDAANGSHGCINIAPDILQKLDKSITYQTHMIIF